jgi:lipopolysaccharide/colanic/teichoic acid biosynthesis glycosyltransferase
MAKRLFDLSISTLALLLLIPLFLAVAVILLLTGEGKVFFRQDRRGQNGRTVRILKFNTMLQNSSCLSGGDITVGNDPRILPVGRFLRAMKIDELPMLIDIVTGDMSVIGPRPLPLRVAALFPESYWAKIADLRPGLSGIGSVVFRNEELLLSRAADRQETYSKVIVPYKSALEVWYAQNQSFFLDLKLTLLTVAVVFIPHIRV